MSNPSFSDLSPSMVERVAAAILTASVEHGWLDTLNPDEAAIYARAVIEAIREPTEAMEDAGDLSLVEAYKSLDANGGEIDYSASGAAWRAMIDAALEPKP